MRKILSGIAFMLLSASQAGAFTENYHVGKQDIVNGCLTQKVWLDAYKLPEVRLDNIIYDYTATAPDTIRNKQIGPIVKIGEDKKKPFALVGIPAYGMGTDGKMHPIASYRLIIDMPVAIQAAAKSTYAGAAASVLATGTWYKIGITHTGFYKVDYNFLKGMGVDPTTVTPSTVRVFGNGGHMLSENNAVARQDDLAENAILMNDGGDGTFGSNDYLVFYAQGPKAWDRDSANQGFTHVNNLYTDTAYYFINFDLGQQGLRVGTQADAPAGNVTVTTFNDYAVHDTDVISPVTIGKYWYGEQFSSTNTAQTLNFSFGSAITSSVTCKFSAAAISAGGGSFNFGIGSTIIDNLYIPGDSGYLIRISSGAATVSANNSSSLSFNVTYTPTGDNDKGYLDYIELNLRRQLQISGDQLNFRDWQSVGSGNIATYQLQGAIDATQVWDVTSLYAPTIMKGINNNGTYTFSQDAAMLHEFAAMNSTNLYAPAYAGKVANQNLHGLALANAIIITYPDFLDAANQLADFHRQNDGMSVVVATTAQIYNEFSSGMQDISALRDFVRMFYKRAGSDTGSVPKYLTLFGGASYDYKNRVAANSDYVPTFESFDSQGGDYTFLTDDFFGFLDDNENLENTGIINTLDIGIGRLPVRTIDDANYLVNKIKVYKSPASLGSWRLATINIGDVEDAAGTHLSDADEMANTVSVNTRDLYNPTKIYLNALPQVTTPAGSRIPDGNAIFDAQVYNGAFLINYNGHGNQYVWSNYRILTQDDWTKWNNADRLPFTVTATCDFGQFDQPSNVSGAEQIVIKKDGGVIAAVTATQPVYEQDNTTLNVNYIKAQFTKNNGVWNTFGTAYEIAKNYSYSTLLSGSLLNFRKFSLLGDPALTPDFPQYQVHIDTVKDGATQQPADSVSALGAYILIGSVRDGAGNILNDFNGTVSVSFYDKPSTINLSTARQSSVSFNTQNNVIYKGKATVTNGAFSVSFIVPKDINYDFGKGKISAYADNGTTDAAGSDTTFTVGGFSDNPVISTSKPVIQPYMNDSFFVNGGITGSSSVLFVKLYSETGINVSGSALGHDLVGIFDGNNNTSYVLNDYYETAPNTYKTGYVSYPVNGLADGRHSILVRGWDVNDNEAEATVDFQVVDGAVADIQNLINYPNPFSDQTHFVFEHNHPNEQMTVQIAIYNTAGAFVRILSDTFIPSGSRSTEMTWDGTDNNGAKLPAGVYVYRLCLTTAAGVKTTAYQKLVISR